MGQARDRVTPSDVTAARLEVEVEADPNVEAERAKVEESRAEMSRTIDEIEGRLTPGHIAGRARDNVVEAASGAGSALVGSIRRNRGPAIVAGLSLGYLVYRAFSPRSMERLRVSGQSYGTTASPTGGVRSAVDRVMESGSDVGDNVRESARRGRDAAEDMAQSAAEQGRDLSSRVEQAVRDNPLGAALVGLGIGAMVALMVPSTQTEEKLVRPAAQPLRERASETAQQVQEKAEKVVSQTADAAREAVNEEVNG